RIWAGCRCSGSASCKSGFCRMRANCQATAARTATVSTALATGHQRLSRCHIPAMLSFRLTADTPPAGPVDNRRGFASLSAVASRTRVSGRWSMLRKLCLVGILALAGVVAGDRWAEPLRAADKDAKPAAKDAPYVHVVLFTLKKDAPPAEADAVIADAH